MVKKGSTEDRFGNEHTFKVYGHRKIKSGDDKHHKVPIISQDGLDWFTSELEFRIKKKFDNVILITGVERTGKSTLGFHVADRFAERMDKDFDETNVFFSGEQLFEACQESDGQEVFILDEAGVDLFAQNWYEEIQKQLIKMFQTFGAKNFTIILVLPHRNLLNKYFREFRVTHWFHCTSTEDLQRGITTLRVPKRNQWAMSAFWEPKRVFRYNKYQGACWEDYEEKKIEFIEKVSQDDQKNNYSKLEFYLYTLTYALYVESNKYETQQELADEINVNQQDISKIVNEIRDSEVLQEQIKDQLDMEKLDL